MVLVLPDYLQPTVQQSETVVEDSPRLETSDPAANLSSDREFEEFSETQGAGAPSLAIVTTDSAASDTVYEFSPIILPITWGAVAGTLIWRGKVRSQWRRQGYDYDTFKLVAKMRGSSTRIELLNTIADRPKNKLQIAKELGVDWKTIDNHIEMLLKNGLVEERMSIGTSRYYGMTKNANRVLSLLSAEEVDQKQTDMHGVTRDSLDQGQHK